ncbi:hypothetical protein [Dolichospermum sp. UHCC 0259]|uniref:hypothetical protein n=1 Tax=Dolichospermum sp. UHCC 0259 TaxID=2590010 RepID=UPI001446C266|nr:hypothetical protein [Dolichospermum sp. UHCC 0259]MTJ46636.1 hypothetical protein [Dolichospermum sp. UHCC 0259]
MQCIHQISFHGIFKEIFGTEKYQHKLRIYSPYPQLQIVIFSKIRAKTGFLTIKEIENLATLVVKEFALNINSVVWIEHDFSQCDLSAAAFSLITFDWDYRQAANPSWLPIHQNWYFDWLQNANLNYITG